ncbi:Aurofusarin cluster transcription factor aurR2 [Exophiala dermatitidis]
MIIIGLFGAEDGLVPSTTGAAGKDNAECKYRILAPRQRRKKADRSQVLLGRWKQYGRPLELKDNAEENRQALPVDSGLSKGRLVQHGKRSKLFENGLWTRVVEELAEPMEALECSSDEEADAYERGVDECEYNSMDYLLCMAPAATGIETFHPSSDHILQLWDVFRANVDPLTKIIHAPSLDKAVRKASSVPNLQSLPRSLDCLLFAIYSTAILSLKDHECRRRFNEPRSTMLSRYRTATKAALSKARFIGSTNLAVLQAFILHIFSVRDVYDSRTVWTLTGLALRMAEGMGLHRDGTVLGLKPFEAEIRRRIWWQLRMMDGRSSELSGLNKTRSLDVDPNAPKMPANVDDDELFPEMTALPEDNPHRATDMAFCCVRFEARKLCAQSVLRHGGTGLGVTTLLDSLAPESDEDIRARDDFIRNIDHILQEKYVRYCDPTRPVQLMATLVAQGAVSLLSLTAHHPRRWSLKSQHNQNQQNQNEDLSQNQKDGQNQDVTIPPPAERRYVWELTLRAIQQWRWVHYSHELQGFIWHAGFYFHWHAFIHILDTLRTDPLIEDAEDVWALVSDVFEISPTYITNTKKALHVAIGALCLKAYTAREAALSKAGRPLPQQTPWYIETLREQRAALRRKKMMKEQKRQSLCDITTTTATLGTRRNVGTGSGSGSGSGPENTGLSARVGNNSSSLAVPGVVPPPLSTSLSSPLPSRSSPPATEHSTAPPAAAPSSTGQYQLGHDRNGKEWQFNNSHNNNNHNSDASPLFAERESNTETHPAHSQPIPGTTTTATTTTTTTTPSPTDSFDTLMQQAPFYNYNDGDEENLEMMLMMMDDDTENSVLNSNNHDHGGLVYDQGPGAIDWVKWDALLNDFT